MDESGFLEEGEIYCYTHNETGPKLLTGNVVITRCPALHPGDVQCVRAVDVPADNPLRALHNVVAFSSHGQRDLPSQLSGGDLDGDLYNIIYDDTLYPQRISQPADYPIATPIDIGKPVERSDITNFFIQFMENDNLGLIATLHQILADQSPDGTFDPDCIRLAGMHSTAVDFSKTGIPVCILDIGGRGVSQHTTDFHRSTSSICLDTRKLVQTFKRPAHVFLWKRTSTSRTWTCQLLQTRTMKSMR